MNNIPPALRRKLEADPLYKFCLRNLVLSDHICEADPARGQHGRMIEWEHALIFAGKQVQEKFAIIPICWWAHRGPGLDKHINEWLALNRASAGELDSISKAIDYRRHLAFLNKRYGRFVIPTLCR